VREGGLPPLFVLAAKVQKSGPSGCYFQRKQTDRKLRMIRRNTPGCLRLTVYREDEALNCYANIRRQFGRSTASAQSEPAKSANIDRRRYFESHAWKCKILTCLSAASAAFDNRHTKDSLSNSKIEEIA